jgi:hypothetical protein
MRKLFRFFGGLAPILLSVMARAGLFLALSWHVYRVAEAAAVAAFFQDLFLQSVMITFLSASSFFAVVSKGWDQSRDAMLVLTHLLMAVATVAVIPVLYGTGVLDGSAATLGALLAGAIATGVGSPLTAVIVRSRGPWMAYTPAIFAAPLFLGLIAVPGLDPVFACVAAVVGFQITVFAASAFIARDVFVQFRAQGAAMMTRAVVRPLWGTFVFGALNTVFVGYFYWFREAWVGLQAAEISAAVLFVYRIFDTLLGIVITDLGSRIDAVRLVERWAKAMLLPLAGLCVVVFAALWWLGQQDLSPVTFAVAGQALLEAVRLPAMVYFLYQSARRASGGYVIYILGTVGVSYALLFALPLQAYPNGFYLFVVLTTLLSSAFTCGLAVLYPVNKRVQMP